MLPWPVERGKPSLHCFGHRTEGPFLLTSPCHLFLPSEPHHTAQAAGVDPRGSGLSHEEEEKEDLRGIARFWQGAPAVEKSLDTNNTGVWRAPSLEPLDFLLRKGKVSVKLGLRKE